MGILQNYFKYLHFVMYLHCALCVFDWQYEFKWCKGICKNIMYPNLNKYRMLILMWDNHLNFIVYLTIISHARLYKTKIEYKFNITFLRKVMLLKDFHKHLLFNLIIHFSAILSVQNFYLKFKIMKNRCRLHDRTLKI